MSNTFDFCRFRQYFRWDLRNAYNNVGLSLLICGSLLFGVYAVTEFFSLVFSGDIADFSDGAKWVVAVVSIFIPMLICPARAYGRLTEKRYGSDWLMIPASTVEKTLSMIVILCLVMPLCLVVMLAFWDCVLSLVFPSSYGEMLLSFKAVGLGLGTDVPGWFVAHISIMSLFEMWCGILVFTLGALCFRKSKVAKTILTYFVAASVLSGICSIVIAHNPDFFGRLSITGDDFDDVHEVFSIFAAVVYTLDVVFIAAVCGAIYYRIRTIKH